MKSKTRFLVDECVGRRLHELLVAEGFESVYVGDWKAGASDEEVVEKSISDQSIILTEDKDFGELVVRRSLRPHGLIIFRTSSVDPERRLTLLKRVLDRTNPSGKLVVITDRIVRVRSLEDF